MNELVIDGVNGNVFNDAAQLSTQLIVTGVLIRCSVFRLLFDKRCRFFFQQTMQLSNRTLDEMRSNLRKRFRIEIVRVLL